MKRFCVMLFCVIALSGCKGTHAMVTTKTMGSPIISSKGNHIWVRPGTNTTHIDIGRVRKW